METNELGNITPTPTISDVDKENFFKAVLSDQPYEEVVPIFGGKTKLTFASITVDQNNDIINQVAIDREKGLAENTEKYFVMLSSYRLGMCLKAVDDVPFLPKTTKEKYTEDATKDTYVSARANGFKKWQHFKLRVYLDAHSKFEKKMDVLSREVFTENFWKAAA